jgi:superfamily II DNA or RNA helicase
MISISFESGTIVVEHPPARLPQYFEFDERVGKWRALAFHYPAFLKFLESRSIPVAKPIAKYSKLNLRLAVDREPHPYQEEALAKWSENGCRGTVILPTGAGKSYLAVKAMEHRDVDTLVVVPTIDLMTQWYSLLTSSFDREVGLLGGGYHEILPITITTYDSAYIHIDKYGDRFGLLIFDEVHHLPTRKYSHIPQMSIAPYRLGLTATYERSDESHQLLDEMIGAPVYRKGIKELKGSYLADYEVYRIWVELNEKEMAEYEKWDAVYKGYMKKNDLKLFKKGWEEFIKKSGYDFEARKALRAFQLSREIALSAQNKFRVLETLLEENSRERILIFTENNEIVYRISEAFLIPAITHQTKTKERKWILDKFREGTYYAIVTSKVLNEGVDVPEAGVAIILSGNAQSREHIQRLGRILRKREGKLAVLYEVITMSTRERVVSYRRRQNEVYFAAESSTRYDREPKDGPEYY